MVRTIDKLSFHEVWVFVVVSTFGVAVLATVWKFGIEEWADPFLAGDHGVDSFGERVEFVVACTFCSLIAMVFPAMLLHRLLADRLASNRLAAAVFNAAPQPMVVTDARRHVMAANPAFEQLTGYAAADVVGQPVSFLKSDQQGSDFYETLGKCIEQSGTWSGEVRNRRPDGSVYVAWLSIRATRDEKGQVGEYVGALTDISWRKKKEDEALHMAMHDPLTGLANRRLFLVRLHQVIAAATISAETVAILYIDLDGFKNINDIHGHGVGDAVLCTTAQRLASCARSADLVARLGGDEFVILLREVDSAEAAGQVAQRCIDLVGTPIACPDLSVTIGASIGVALTSHEIGSAETLLNLADTTMYAAKRQGRGCYLIRTENGSGAC